MLKYNILQKNYIIGVSMGKNNAFKFIQKEIDRSDLFGYWKGDCYIVDGKPEFIIERASNE